MFLLAVVLYGWVALSYSLAYFKISSGIKTTCSNRFLQLKKVVFSIVSKILRSQEVKYILEPAFELPIRWFHSCKLEAELEGSKTCVRDNFMHMAVSFVSTCASRKLVFLDVFLLERYICRKEETPCSVLLTESLAFWSSTCLYIQKSK